MQSTCVNETTLGEDDDLQFKVKRSAISIDWAVLERPTVSTLRSSPFDANTSIRFPPERSLLRFARS